MFPAKLNDKIFQSKGHTIFLFWGHFCPKEIFLKTLVKYNCSGPPLFTCQRYRESLDWSSSQKLFYYCQHAKIIQSICSFHQIILEVHLI